MQCLLQSTFFASVIAQVINIALHDKDRGRIAAFRSLLLFMTTLTSVDTTDKKTESLATILIGYFIYLITFIKILLYFNKILFTGYLNLHVKHSVPL